MRINRGQEFVIGGYTLSDRNFDALIFGYYYDGKLQYATRTRNGFTPSSRAQLFKKLKPLETKECPFANLPEARSGRWGVGLTAAKMKDCRWVNPVLVVQFEFTEWTPDNHLRHSRFIAPDVPLAMLRCSSATQRDPRSSIAADQNGESSLRANWRHLETSPISGDPGDRATR